MNYMHMEDTFRAWNLLSSDAWVRLVPAENFHMIL